MKKFKFELCVVGGAGHVGFPIGLMFASKNCKVCLLDNNVEQLKKISKGEIPFKEKKGKNFLKKFKKNIFLTSDPKFIKDSKNIIICIGTPIKSNLKPELKNFFKFFRSIKKYLTKDHDNFHLIMHLHSTTFLLFSYLLQEALDPCLHPRFSPY